MASRKNVSQGLVQHTKLVQTEESILPIFFQKPVFHKIPFQNFVLKFTCLCVQISFQSKQTSLKHLFYVDWAIGGATSSDTISL